MLRKSMMNKLPSLMLMLMFVNVLPCFAQSSASNPQNAKQNKTVQVDEQFLIEAQKALADRDRLKAEVTAKDELITSLTAQNDALRGLLDVEKQISASWKDAALNRKQALSIDDAMMKAYDKRVSELVAERDAARRGQKWYGFVGLILGAGLGWAAQK